MKVPCVKCGGAVPLERDEAFLRCPFCDSTLFMDRASTFLHLNMAASLRETQAQDRLARELQRLEIPPQPVDSVEKLLLPFWEIRGGSTTTTEPAFAPIPDPLAGYRIPAGGASARGGSGAEEFAPVECAETASARWEGGAPQGLSLVSVPFYRITFGGRQFSAWVDGVSGAVFPVQFPPSNASANHQRALKLFVGLFALFALEAALIPSAGLGFFAVAGTAVALFPTVKRKLTPGGEL